MQYFYKSTEIAHINLPALLNLGRWRLEMPHARRRHYYYWVTRGQGRVSINGATRGVAANTLLFIPSGTVHALHCGAQIRGYAVALPAHLPVPVPDAAARIRGASIFEQGQITGYFEQIARECAGQAAGAENAMESYLTLLAVWIERQHAQNDWNDTRTATATARLVARFMCWLEKNRWNKPGVAAAAGALGVTTTHLGRSIRTLTGKTASEVIRTRLIFEAALRLAEGNEKITGVAAALGFANAAYFSRVFHAVMGISPRAFRQQCRQGARDRANRT